MRGEELAHLRSRLVGVLRARERIDIGGDRGAQQQVFRGIAASAYRCPIDDTAESGVGLERSHRQMRPVDLAHPKTVRHEVRRMAQQQENCTAIAICLASHLAPCSSAIT